MPATKKPARPASATASKEADVRRIDHITKSLDAAQKDLAAMGGSLETGVRDLQRDVTKMLRNARRDIVKLRRALQRDLGRLQTDLVAAARPAAPRRATATARESRRHTAAAAH